MTSFASGIWPRKIYLTKYRYKWYCNPRVCNNASCTRRDDMVGVMTVVGLQWNKLINESHKWFVNRFIGIFYSDIRWQNYCMSTDKFLFNHGWKFPPQKLRSEYSERTRSCILMPMILASLGHQHQWHWLCREYGYLFSMRKVNQPIN